MVQRPALRFGHAHPRGLMGNAVHIAPITLCHEPHGLVLQRFHTGICLTFLFFTFPDIFSCNYEE